MNLIDTDLLESSNSTQRAHLDSDYQALGNKLARNSIDIDEITKQARELEVAVPSWGVGTGGTRFARFPGIGEPRHVFDKLEDCGVINQLTRVTPTVSLHIPWDDENPSELRDKAKNLNLRFDAMNSNTFQDQPDQPHSYKFGSLSHSDSKTRDQAIAHNIRCIEIGKEIGSKALTVWVGDGSNFPGQSNLTKQFERYLDSLRSVYAALPDDWQLFTEHKMYEPAFYSTVVQDWGTNLLIAQELGDKANCLVDLGHHAPNVNIEMIVARLIQFNKLGGFHFNDSKYGDDDLDTAAIDPFRLFLVFNELVDATLNHGESFTPAYMLDQSHNVTDPIESLMSSAIEVQRAFVLALLVDRTRLAEYQDANDVIMAARTLKLAFLTDVEPILAMSRVSNGGAIDPISTYRSSGYRQAVAKIRPVVSGAGGGIV